MPYLSRRLALAPLTWVRFLSASVTAAAVLTSPAASAAEDSPLPSLPYETVHLRNGLRVLLAPDPQARLASVQVSYEVGSADDPNGRHGLAHVVEHLLFHRLKHVELPFRVFDAAGASRVNAKTRVDDTQYFETVPPERLETILWLESDRMGYGANAFTEEGLAAVTREVKNETRERALDGPLAGIGGMVHRELFPAWHPYTGAEIGDDDLDDITIDDARAFFHTWYSPSNATLAIAGRFERDPTIALVERYFGSLPLAHPPVRPSLPAWVTPNVRLTAATSSTAEGVYVAWRTPPYGTADDAALDLAANALSGTGNERLTRALIANHLATSVFAHQTSNRRDSTFWVQAAVAPGVKPAKVIDVIQETIDHLALASSPEEIARARRLWHATALSALETSWERATLLASLAEIGLDTPQGTPDWGFGRYEHLSAGDVQRAVATWLGTEHRVAVALLAGIPTPIRGKLLKREEVQP